MSIEESPHPKPTLDMKRAWRFVTWAGLLGSTYYLACIIGIPRIKFLTELGATAFDFGLISGLASAALTFQIVGSILGNRVRRRKPVWMTMAITHRVVYLGIIFAPFFLSTPRARMAWLMMIFFLSDALAQTGSPIWLSWMADMLPKEAMSRYWAARQRFITAFNILVMVSIAFGFHFFEINNRVIPGFLVLVTIGVVLGVTDILLFLGVPEPLHERLERAPFFATLTQPVRDREFRPFLLYIGCWYFAVFTSAPFFGLFMIDHLGMSVLTVQLLSAAAALGTALSSRFWGLICDGYGYRPLLQVLAVAKSLTPLPFVFAPDAPLFCIPYLALVMFIDGVLNSGMDIAIQIPMLRETPRRNRTMYIAATNFFAVGLMAGIAPVISGTCIDYFNRMGTLDGGWIRFNGYHIVFAASVLLRGAASLLTSGLRERHAMSWRAIVRQVKPRASLRVMRLAQRLQESKDVAERVQVARRLGESCSPMAIGDLISALSDPEREVRDAAADALGLIGATAAAQPLAGALFDPGSGIQTTAARALGRIRSVDSLRALLRNLTNLNSGALLETIDSLAQHGNDAAVLPLICLFNDVEDPELRERIAQALGKLTQTESTEEVRLLLRGRSPGRQ